jgi:hypothetical protein
MENARPRDGEAEFPGDAVAEVLDGRRSYDDLDDASQTLVRRHWRQEIDAQIRALDLGAEFEAAGTPYAEFVDGTVVVH